MLLILPSFTPADQPDLSGQAPLKKPCTHSTNDFFLVRALCISVSTHGDDRAVYFSFQKQTSYTFSRGTFLGERDVTKFQGCIRLAV